MARASRQNSDVREYILRNVTANPRGVAGLAVTEFGLSRTAINRYLRNLVDEGLLTASGKTSGRSYELKNIIEKFYQMENITASSSESDVWKYRILPEIKEIPKNIVDICQYGFTEILNNVIDHSISNDASISYEQNYCEITMNIIDSGIGIFEKIKKDFDLPDAQSALLELSKGKLTSDKKRHSGEGIFFTSRMFDEFYIHSGNLAYLKVRNDQDGWLIDVGDRIDYHQGTEVGMKIATDVTRTPRQVFDEYQTGVVGFRRTHVPIKLAQYADEQLVSRSQAKRILTRFEDFSEVILDFEGVPDIGQPFADEIFRVFRNDHPKIRLLAMHTSREIEDMIAYVQAAAVN